MRTDDLVRLLAEDNAGARHAARREWRAAQGALAVGVATTLAIFAFGVGLRADLGAAAGATVLKQAVTFAAIAAGFVALRRLSSPEGGRFRGWLAPLCIVALWMLWEVLSGGGAGWQARMIGRNNLLCLVTIPALSLPVLGGLLIGLRSRAPASAVLAGAAAGLAAAGVGASLYALHCTDDSALFVALWYSIAAAMMAALGAALGRAVLRW